MVQFIECDDILFHSEALKLKQHTFALRLPFPLFKQYNYCATRFRWLRCFKTDKFNRINLCTTQNKTQILAITFHLYLKSLLCIYQTAANWPTMQCLAFYDFECAINLIGEKKRMLDYYELN